MTTSTTDPAPAPVARPARPAPQGLLRATAVIATVGVACALLGIVLLLRPVTTPAQDCGTSLAFLVEGRVDVLVSETDPPDGITRAEAKANNASPCRARVADRAKPAGVLFVAGLVAALGAAALEVGIRTATWLGRRRARRTGAVTAPADPASPDAAGPAVP